MKKITEIAQQFHTDFEGKDLYPKFSSWQWVVATLFAIAFLFSVGYFIYVLANNQKHN